MDGWSDGTILVLSLAATAVGLFVPAGWFDRLRPWADRTVVCGIVVALLGLGTNLAVVALRGVPRAHVNDEYGYLLIADTLRHGRLTNPTPADPDAFASPHVLLRPTYTAKYPPAQGAALAAGELLGRPAYGVWVTAAAAAAAIYWMLLAFVPPPWAVLGGLVAATLPQVVQWGHTYWGGGVAMLGGATTLGAWGRLARGPAACGFADQRPPIREAASGQTRRAAVLLGLGLLILATSRPYEGLMLSLPLVATVLPRWRRLTTAVPVLVAGGALMLLYDARVTGHALRLPIVEYARQYDVAPKFWWMPLRASVPTYPNDTLAWMHAGFEVGEYRIWQTLPGVLHNTVRRAIDLVWTFARPGLLLVPFAFAVAAGRRLVWVWVTLGVFALGLWLETFYLHHYAAPVVGVLVLLTVVGWRRLHGWSPRLGRGLIVGYAVAAALAAAGVDRQWTNVGQDALPELMPDLRSGRHLIFVRYTADHLPHDEWVYDGADPAGQRLLWVRWRGPTTDRAVVRDYPGRQVWLLTVGRHDLSPQRYAP